MSNTTPLHNHSLLFDYVRQIRAEALNLHETATDLTTTLNDTKLSDSDALMRMHHAILIGNKIIEEHGPQVQTCFDRIDTILQQHPELNNWDGNDVGGDITTIRDAWDKARWNWPASSEEQLLTKQQLQYQLDDIAQSLLHLCVTAQMLTFPDLVNQKLSQMHTGEKLDFFSEFSDAFFDPEFLPIAWTYLRNHPRHIDGFMTDNGIIYRASHSQQKRILSLLLIAASVGIGFLLIWLFSILFPQRGALDVLFKGYGAVIVGGLVHTFVDVWKQYKAQPDHTANMMDNWTLWVHVKEHSILYGIITLWAGFIILIIIGQVQDIIAAFFAGYSVDSLLGLFLTRFTDTASQRVQALDMSIPKSTAQQVAAVISQHPPTSKLSSHVS